MHSCTGLGLSVHLSHIRVYFSPTCVCLASLHPSRIQFIAPFCISLPRQTRRAVAASAFSGFRVGDQVSSFVLMGIASDPHRRSANLSLPIRPSYPIPIPISYLILFSQNVEGSRCMVLGAVLRSCVQFGTSPPPSLFKVSPSGTISIWIPLFLFFFHASIHIPLTFPNPSPFCQSRFLAKWTPRVVPFLLIFLFHSNRPSLCN